ncbi:hypothetical protein GOP47_0005355 [Adiantum capillus-veneris]|uniref:C3H1-type domain-containing protein n=1 Tax=Adiantum capillus-veneris TaxID=13818 RepID=A0A9D4V4Y1_ADICA|nr:hypothetical protein GOP47_0005355 [Adiantum capillus-veneris]
MPAAGILNTRSDRVGNQFRHIHVPSENEKIVSWPLAGKICEVHHPLVDDAHSYVPKDLQCLQGNALPFNEAHHLSRSVKRARMTEQDIMEAHHLSRSVKRARMTEQDIMDVPPGFGCCIMAGKSARPKAQLDVLMAITSPWHLPDKFICNDSWLWAGGEESLEVASQQERERRSLEAFYPHFASIPDSPWEPQAPIVEIDDAVVPQIPLVFVEEDKPESEHKKHESDKGVILRVTEPGKMVDELYEINDILHGIAMKRQQQENVNRIVDSKIAATAVAACMVVRAWGKSNLVDEKLLIEILKNPSLLKSLTSSHNSMEGKCQDQDTNMQVAEGHLLPTDSGAESQKSPASVPGHWGDGVDINESHKMAASSLESTRMQEFNNLSCRSMNPFPQTSIPTSYPCRSAALNMDSAQKRFENRPRVHRRINENSKMNSVSSNLMEDAPYGPRHEMRNKNGNGKDMHTHGTQASSLLTDDSQQRHPMQAEATKYRSAEDCKLPRKTNAFRMSSKTGGRAKRNCMFYNTPRGCRNGETCAFVHQTKPAVTTMAQ